MVDLRLLSLNCLDTIYIALDILICFYWNIKPN